MDEDAIFELARIAAPDRPIAVGAVGDNVSEQPDHGLAPIRSQGREVSRPAVKLGGSRPTCSATPRTSARERSRRCASGSRTPSARSANPAKRAAPNPQPPPRSVRTYSVEEVEAIAAELSPAFRGLPAFAAATGLRPEEWQVLERRDMDRAGRLLNVRRTLSGGEVVELAKTRRSRRQVPLSERALEAVGEGPARLDTPYIFAASRGGPFDLHNFRRREWAPAIEASGVAKPARIYDLRSTFASNALAAGVSVFEWRASWVRASP